MVKTFSVTKGQGYSIALTNLRSKVKVLSSHYWGTGTYNLDRIVNFLYFNTNFTSLMNPGPCDDIANIIIITFTHLYVSSLSHLPPSLVPSPPSQLLSLAVRITRYWYCKRR